MEVILGIAIILIKILTIFGVTMFIAGWTTWVERKIIGDMQFRVGVERTGPYGLMQPMADGLKLFFKESIVPDGCDRVTYELAPVLALVPAIMSIAIVPFAGSADSFKIFGQTPFIAANINIGILFLFAWSSLSPYGMIFAGWSSNNKYSLLGALRSAALVISYEIPFGFSIIGILMIVGSLNLIDIVNAQGSYHWFIYRQPVAALVFFISIVAETNRPPFDLSEAESELVAGYFTEYAGMRFSLFFLGEYIMLFVISSMFTVFFLGGWHGPFISYDVVNNTWVQAIPGIGILWFVIKSYFIVFVYMWLRASLPRIRYDQMMSFCWKVLLPLSILNIFTTALLNLDKL